MKAQENHPDSLLQALRDGHYYSSQGPDFHNIAWSENSVDVESSAVASVILQGQGTRTVAIHGESLTQTQVPLERLAHTPWLRVTIIDHAGRRAWCNPVWR